MSSIMNRILKSATMTDDIANDIISRLKDEEEFPCEIEPLVCNSLIELKTIIYVNTFGDGIEKFGCEITIQKGTNGDLFIDCVLDEDSDVAAELIHDKVYKLISEESE